MWRPATAAADESFVSMCADLNREDPEFDPVPPEHMRRTLISAARAIFDAALLKKKDKAA